MHLITIAARKPRRRIKVSDFDDEMTIASKLMGVKVRRAPAIFVDELPKEEPKRKKWERAAKTVEARRKERIEFHKNREKMNK